MKSMLSEPQHKFYADNVLPPPGRYEEAGHEHGPLDRKFQTKNEYKPPLKKKDVHAPCESTIFVSLSTEKQSSNVPTAM
jgi:hypothetical protein